MVRILAIPAILLIAAAPALAQHGHSGGMAMGHSSADLGSHMSAQGLENTNGPRAADRDFGRDRAEDRMSANGLAHSNGDHVNGDHAKKHKHHEPHGQ